MNKIALPAEAVCGGLALSRAWHALSCNLTTSTEGQSVYTAKSLFVVNKQLLRVMKLTGFLILALCLHVSATGVGQSISLSLKDAPLKKVFTEIIRQSGTTIIYNDIILKDAKPVTIEVKNASAEDVLNLSLKGQPLSYTIEDGLIIVKPATTGGLNSGLDKKNFSASVSFLPPGPIKGMVRDVHGKALAGINIVVKGTKRGTVSDKDGFFTIEANVGDKLIFSGIGYGNKEVAVDSQGTVTAVMQISTSPLDEVQIIAYGQTSQRLNIGNVFSVKADKIQQQPVSNPLYALQGRVPGLQVTPTTGLSGGAINLQIRGNNSLGFTTNPLIVIDGLPITKYNLPGLGHNALSEISVLAFFNINDIESIEVLKDGDATSIYGSRGANGVILITTRKGKSGKTSININMQSGMSDVAQKMKLLNTEEYIEMRKEAYLNSGIDIATLPVNRSNVDITQWDQNRYTDWQKELLGGTAKFHDLQTSISGGTPTIQYIIGGNFHKETTVFKGDNSDKKTTVHFSLTGLSSNQKFKATVTANYTSAVNTLPGIDFTRAALTLPPNAPSLYTENGDLNWELMPSGARSWDNPYTELYRTYEATIDNMVASADISYKILPSLIIKTTVGFNELKGSSFRKRYPFAGRPVDDPFSAASAAINETGTRNISVEPQLVYDLKKNNSSFNLLIGGAYQETTSESQLIDYSGITSDALLKNLANADPTMTFLSNTSSAYKYVALFGRLTYDYNKKYLLNLTVRRDGSSRFGPANQFGNFGSIGVGWIFSEENYIKQNIPFLSFGKIRGSYGSSGNDAIGDYQYMERYEAMSGTDPYLGNRGYQTTGIFNAQYAWESTRKLEAGIEIGMFKDRIFVSGSYFRNRSDNQLVASPYPTMVGPGVAFVNSPVLVQNAGLELILNSDIFKNKNFTWSAAINYSNVKNKVVRFNDIDKFGYNVRVGQPFYGVAAVFKFSGVDTQTGVYQFADKNKQLTVYPDTTFNILTQPAFYGGLSNSFTYKGFNLEFLFQFSKQKIKSHIASYMNVAGRIINLPVEFTDRWKSPGDLGPIQKIYFIKPGEYADAINTFQSSDALYVDGSFIRLKNLSISYTFKPSLLNKIKVQQLKIFLHGQNLLTFTKYKGLDPETQSVAALPPLRTITSGLQITF